MRNAVLEIYGHTRDPLLSEHFLERVFARRRVSDFFAGKWTLGELVAFHSAEKMQLLAHDPHTYRQMGRLVARGSHIASHALADDYTRLHRVAMSKRSTRRNHVNVLQHLAGHFKQDTSRLRGELLARIGEYADALVPLIAPVRLVRALARNTNAAWVANQTYLQPYPIELTSRNQS